MDINIYVSIDVCMYMHIPIYYTHMYIAYISICVYDSLQQFAYTYIYKLL